MHLITSAHLGEAQGVIEIFNLKRQGPQFFEGESLSCLITGEGPFEAAAATSMALGKTAYTSVINLGIAGALSNDLVVGDIHPVRSVYLSIESRPQFKSFRSFDHGLDCLTSFERIITPEKASPLSGIAHLVDREAWGVGMSAKTAQVPFQSFKLISDLAGTLGACELSKDRAQEWAWALGQHLQTHLKDERSAEKIETNLPGFHFTFTTRHQFQQMVKRLSLRENIDEGEVLANLPIEKLLQEISSPKERAKALIEAMEAKLDPLKDKLKKSLDQLRSPFEKQGIALQTDPSWESPELKVQFGVSSQKELEQKLNILSHLNYSAYQRLRNGDFDVE